MPNKKLRSVTGVSVLLTFVALGNAPALHAQAVSIASVTGRVLDEQGAVVSGAQIRMIGVETGTVSSGHQLGWHLHHPQSADRAYTLESTVSEFQTYVQSGILLRVGDHVQINVNMKVGAVAERVDAQANAGLVRRLAAAGR